MKLMMNQQHSVKRTVISFSVALAMSLLSIYIQHYSEAKEIAVQMIEESKNKAKVEANKIVENAMSTISLEKAAAISDLKNQLASFSLSIAEKIVRGELASDEKQKSLADKLADDINMN